jgi:hypothetical protein
MQLLLNCCHSTFTPDSLQYFTTFCLPCPHHSSSTPFTTLHLLWTRSLSQPPPSLKLRHNACTHQHQKFTSNRCRSTFTPGPSSAPFTPLQLPTLHLRYFLPQPPTLSYNSCTHLLVIVQIPSWAMPVSLDLRLLSLPLRKSWTPVTSWSSGQYYLITAALFCLKKSPSLSLPHSRS